MTYSYNQYENAAELIVSTPSDPFVLLGVESFVNVSADTYKYVVITYKAPVTNASTEKTTELFMSAGSVAVPTAGCSVKFNHTNSYKYITQTIDMSAASYWNGTVHSIRFDIFPARSEGAHV